MEIEADGNDWIMQSMITSGPSDDDPKPHVLSVKWKDYTHEENTRETYENVAENDLQLLEEYYRNTPPMERDKRVKGIKPGMKRKRN